MSAIQRIRPWLVSSNFVCVFTWYGVRGRGDTAGRVDVEAGREEFCIFEAQPTIETYKQIKEKTTSASPGHITSNNP